MEWNVIRRMSKCEDFEILTDCIFMALIYA